MKQFLEKAHDDWQPLLNKALDKMDPMYLDTLISTSDWLPQNNNLFKAFSLPLTKLSYILMGESPYPRPQSANGYAFYDAAVGDIWSKTGFSKAVNRATSLRNLFKMLLVARGDLQNDVSQEAVSHLNHTSYWQTGQEFFINLINKGFLLLNASLVYRIGEIAYHAKQWQPFMTSLFSQLEKYSHVTLILLGKIAKEIPAQPNFETVIAEHPYNLSFIRNPSVLELFKPLDLLKK